MDLEKLLAIVRRQWQAVAAVLLVTAVAALQVPGRVAPSYEMAGNVILLSPATVETTTGDDQRVNPWSRFGGAESGAVTALIEVLRSDSTEALVEEDDAVETYTIGANPGNGAIISVAVTASTEASAVATYQLLLELINTELNDRQAASGAPEDTWLQAEVLTKPDAPTELPGSEERAILAVGVLGALAAVCLAIALDAVVVPRQRRRRSQLERPDLALYELAAPEPPAPLKARGFAPVSFDAWWKRERSS